MSSNKGKAWEARFAHDWTISFPKSFLFRIPDQLSGLETSSQNPCDFIGFVQQELFLVECKSVDNNTLNFSSGFPQYPRLLKYKDLPHVHPGVLIWYKDHDRVLWVPIKEAEKIYNKGNKSINIKHAADPDYHIVEIPVQKKRVFVQGDYRALLEDKNT